MSTFPFPVPPHPTCTHDDTCSGRLLWAQRGVWLRTLMCDDCGSVVALLGSLDHEVGPILSIPDHEEARDGRR